MSRPTLGQLAYKQVQAEHAFPVGTHVLHQSSDKVYEITGHSIDEALGEPRIHYRPIICDGKLEIIRFGEASIERLSFSRLAAEFDEIVVIGIDGNENPIKSRRFVKVKRSEDWVRV